MVSFETPLFLNAYKAGKEQFYEKVFKKVCSNRYGGYDDHGNGSDSVCKTGKVTRDMDFPSPKSIKKGVNEDEKNKSVQDFFDDIRISVSGAWVCRYCPADPAYSSFLYGDSILFRQKFQKAA